MSKKLYLFDFDGTLTYKDSLFHFLKNSFGPSKYYSTWITFFPIFIWVGFKTWSKSAIKESLLKAFLQGKTRTHLEDLGRNYTDHYLDSILRPQALDFLQDLVRKGEEIYIVSASIDVWLEHVARKLQVKLICTEIEYQKDICTGKFDGKNCRGAEKVKKLRHHIDLKDYNEIISFGDSAGDKEMFEVSTKFYYKPFRTS